MQLSGQWQQIQSNGGQVHMQGILEWCNCATEPAADNACHLLNGELKLPEGINPWVRQARGYDGQSYMTYTVFE